MVPAKSGVIRKAFIKGEAQRFFRDFLLSSILWDPGDPTKVIYNFWQLGKPLSCMPPADIKFRGQILVPDWGDKVDSDIGLPNAHGTCVGDWGRLWSRDTVML
jgi:hypothetical protein